MQCLKRELIGLRQNLREMVTLNEELEDEVGQKQLKVEEAEQSIETLKNEINILKSTISGFEVKLSDCEKKMREVEEFKMTLESDIKKYRKMFLDIKNIMKREDISLIIEPELKTSNQNKRVITNTNQ